ncbi:uncharacterized protein LOC119089403 [Pollicipes pollicipes]|uniref:uncharacterized protein LOC119089403 n=1 Tax=Pollicipes pollicipes TaxID=41117 RepID=UPI001885066A|nr:uncharacterized protein LOC119089403 [Pollicipes pollicipes]
MEIITHAVTCIRYVIKYVTKGGDQVMFWVSAGDEVVDEIATYQQGRYLNAVEMAWRHFGYPVHRHQPPAQQLSVHLSGDDQPLRFRARVNSPRQVTENAGADTKPTGLFKRCAEDEFARTLLCHNVPRYYTWQTGARCWRRRRRGTLDVAGIFAAEAIGRVYTASPRAGEAFFLRLLLHNVRGPRSYEELRTVDGQLRRLLTVIGVEDRASCDLLRLWRTFRHAMSEDVRHRLSRVGGGGGVGDTEGIDEADGSAGGKAIAVASSGIAASLLDGGMTAHCRFSIPLHLHDASTCDLRNSSPAADDFRRCVLLHVTCLTLRTNMRAQLQGDAEAGEYTRFLCRLGSSQLPLCPYTEDHVVLLPAVRSSARSLAELAAWIYPDLSQNIGDTEWFEERAILTVFNAGVKRINDHVIDRPPGPGHVYTSVDSMSDPGAVPLATEVLNGIELSGTPAHCIRLKAGAPVLLMRNLDAPNSIIGTLCVT